METQSRLQTCGLFLNLLEKTKHPSKINAIENKIQRKGGQDLNTTQPRV